jgi:hypothetical protein
MRSCRRAGVIILISIAASALHAAYLGSPALAEDCASGFLRSSIAGEGSRVKLSLGGQVAACGQDQVKDIGLEPQPYFTHEIACSSDRQAAAEGLCSTTPCPDIRRFFAFRTIHFPDGTVQPAGFQCVSLAEAAARPGMTVGQVFDAVRRVRLPGGEIGVEPGARGLANLESFFWVEGANQPPVDLQVGGSTVHAEFRVVEYRWAFGDDQGLVTTGPGSPGLDSEVSTTFRRKGFYRVGVTVAWVAEAWLDGRRVGEVNDLVSRAQTTYPVAELRTVLTG